MIDHIWWEYDGDMDALSSTIIPVLVTAILTAIGYSLKRIFEKVDAIAMDVSEMKPKVDILWKDKFAQSFSPRQLNELGKDILNKSGIKEIIDSKKQRLLEAVRELDPKNAYDAEQDISSVVNELPKYCPGIVDQLKDGAFKVGQNIDALLLVGSIYLRDLIFSDLGFSLVDLDKSETA